MSKGDVLPRLAIPLRRNYDQNVPGWVDVDSMSHDDREMWEQEEPQCAGCVFALPYAEVSDDGPTLRCVAFPAGVPFEIFSNEFDHAYPWPYGDESARTFTRMTIGAE